MQLIDTLVVALGFDTSGLKKGQKDAQASLEKTGKAAEKQQRELDAAAKRTTESYKKVRDSILELTAVIVGAVAGKEFLAYITATDIGVGRLSKNLGVATEELSAWEGVARRLGGQGSDADSLFRGVNELLQDARLNGGSGKMSPLVRAGLDLTKFLDKSTSYTQRLLMMRDAMRKLDAPAAQRFGQMAGFSEEGLNILLQTDRALEQMLETQRKMNVETEADRKNAVDRNEAWSDLTETMTGFGRKVAVELSPLLNGTLHGLRDMFLWMEDHVPVSIGLLGALGSAVLLLKGYSIATFAAQFTGNLAVMGMAVGGLLGKLGLLGAAFSSAYLITSAIGEATGWWDKLGSWIYDKANGNGPDMAGGYVPGTVKGLGNRGSAGATDYSSLEAAAGLPAGLLSAIKRTETGTGSGVGAVSPKGARGPFQFMGPTAAQYGVTNPDDPQQAAQGAAKYLSYLLKLFKGNLPMAIAAYNEGEGAAARGAMPLETQKYVSDVMGRLGQGSRAGGGGTSVTTGDIHIHSQAKDSAGVARDTVRELRNLNLAAQANRGLG